MKQINIWLDDKADDLVSKYKKKWKINRPDVINKIIKQFREQ